MRAMNRIKIFTVGSAMLITSAAAVAGPPISYNGFTASGGTITPDTSFCTGGSPTFSCSTPLTGNGFLQRSITDLSTGTTYFQTIILPTNADVATAGDIANLAFADENFVQQGGGTGIADQQSNFAVGTTANPGDFSSSTKINAGWAQGSGPVVELTQSIDDPYVPAVAGPPAVAAHGSDFFLDFALTGDGTQATSLKVNQSVSLCTDLSDTGCTDKQVLDVRRLIASSASSTSALPSDAQLQGPAQVSYGINDIIQAVWLGQAVTTTTGAATPDKSGFLGYTNVTAQLANPLDGTTSNGYSSQTETGPDFGGTTVYDPVFTGGVFGSAPSSF